MTKRPNAWAAKETKGAPRPHGRPEAHKPARPRPGTSSKRLEESGQGGAGHGAREGASASAPVEVGTQLELIPGEPMIMMTPPNDTCSAALCTRRFIADQATLSKIARIVPDSGHKGTRRAAARHWAMVCHANPRALGT